MTGLFNFQIARITIGQVDFVYPKQDDPTLLQVRRNPKGPKIILRTPYDCALSVFGYYALGLIFSVVALDDEPRVILEVHTGSCSMLGAQLVLTSSQDGDDVRFLLEHSACKDTGG